MKYKGIELKEFTSGKPVAFDPPKLMLVWDNDVQVPIKVEVCALMPNRRYPVIALDNVFKNCAEIPDKGSELATNRELAKWLVLGNGQCKVNGGDWIWTEHHYGIKQDDDACSKFIKVRKWGDREWHEPTREYLGLED